MEDPVVPLERNLYGHPLAGLLWERQFEKILLQRQDPQSSSMPTPRLNQGIGSFKPLCHTGRAYSHNGMMITRDIKSRKRILENSRTHWNFKAGQSTSRLTCVQNQRFFTSQCTGSKKFEIAKSIDDLMTSQSITGRRYFSDYEMVDAKIASA